MSKEKIGNTRPERDRNEKAKDERFFARTSEYPFTADKLIVGWQKEEAYSKRCERGEADSLPRPRSVSSFYLRSEGARERGEKARGIA